MTGLPQLASQMLALKVIDFPIHPHQHAAIFIAGWLRLWVDDAEAHPSGGDGRANVGMNLVPRLMFNDMAHAVKQLAQLVRGVTWANHSYQSWHFVSLSTM
jgi:hypothetical protein